MILLYTLVLSFLRAAALLVGYRARALEKKFTRTAAEVARLLHESQPKPGNGNRAETFHNLRRQYRLGMLVEKQDRLEGRHYARQRLADRLNWAVARLQAWKGRKLPYTFGVVDVSLLLYALDQFGVGDYARPENFVTLVQTLIAK